MKILVMGMALRKGSFNKKLAKNAHRLLGGDAELLSFNDYPMPVYDGDIEAGPGIPETVKTLAAKIQSAGALVLSTPEYNGSIPGPFKNAIDWVSRVRPMPWAGKQVLLLGASPGALGAVRGLWHGRVPLEVAGCHVYPDVFGVPKADQAFDENDLIKDSALEERLGAILGKFQTHINSFNVK